jgi:hypothetical protein
VDSTKSKGTATFEPVRVDPALEPHLRSYRRLWLAQVDLEEAKATVDELLRLRLPIRRFDRPAPLQMALTTALVVSYARPFVNSRGQSSYADKTIPGSLLKTFSSGDREFHRVLLDIRNREVAHSDAEAMELSLKLFPDGHGAILRVARDPFTLAELRKLRRMIEKLQSQIDNRCTELRTILPHEVWL